MPERMRPYHERVTAQIEAIPSLRTPEGHKYVKERRGELLAGTLMHVLRRLHEDEKIPDEVAQELIDRCKESLLGADPNHPRDEDVSRLLKSIEWRAKRSFRDDAPYGPGDFVNDFLLHYLFRAFDGRDGNSHWVTDTHKKAFFRLLDARREAYGRRRMRGLTGGGRDTPMEWGGEIPLEYSDSVDQVDAVAEARERAAIEAALQRLPEELQRVLELYFEGCQMKKGKNPDGTSMEEIEGKSSVALYARLDRALARLEADPEFLAAMVDIREGRTGGGQRRTKRSKESEES